MHQAKIEAATAAALAATAQHARDLHAKGKEQRAAWAGDRKELLSDQRLERIAAEERALQLEEAVTRLKQEVARLHLAVQACARQSEAAVKTADNKAAAHAAKVLAHQDPRAPRLCDAQHFGRMGRRLIIGCLHRRL